MLAVWAIIVGVAGLPVVGVLVVSGRDVRQAATTGPRWRRRLISGGPGRAGCGGIGWLRILHTHSNVLRTSANVPTRQHHHLTTLIRRTDSDRKADRGRAGRARMCWTSVMTLVVVLLILTVLLRSIVAPLTSSVRWSSRTSAAIGIGVLTFSTDARSGVRIGACPLAFVVLVAVGADYNLLFVSRTCATRSPHSVRFGVIRTLGSRVV